MKRNDIRNDQKETKQQAETSEFIIGRNSVREALRAGEQIERILVVKNGDGSIGQLLAMAKEANIIIREVPKSKLDEISADMGYDGKPGNHQGIAAQVPAFRYSEMQDILQLAEKRGEPPFIVVLDGVQDPHNLGAIIRSAEALGAHGVVIGKRRSASLTSAVYKVSSGAAEFIPVVKVTNINRTIAELKEQNIWAIAADMTGTPLSSANLTGATALVIGSEGTGVSKHTKELCDMAVCIDMAGQTQSLNAACAASVFLYEKRRQDMKNKG